MTLSPSAERDAAHAHRIAALEDAHVVDREADALAARRGQQDVVLLGADLRRRRCLRPRRASWRSCRRGSPGRSRDSLLRRTVPRVVANITSSVSQVASSSGSGMMVVMRSPCLERQHVDQRLAARLRRGERQAPDLLLVDLARRREEQDRRDGSRRRTGGRRNPRRASACRSGPCRRAAARGRSRAARA